MELLETQDPEKKKLIETSNRHKMELQKELSAISDKTEATLKNALIIGGTLAVAYLLVSNIGSSVKTKRKKAKLKSKAISSMDDDNETQPVEEHAPMPSFLSQIGENLASHATIILLDLAKEKLAEYLLKRKMKDENS
jgi:hypothetical protein